MQRNVTTAKEVGEAGMTQDVKIYLIRHGRPSAGFGESLDPGLDDVGWAQAETVAQELAPLGPLPILTSPLRRARDTAVPLERAWQVTARIEPAVAELPTPGAEPQARAIWVREALRGRWWDLGDFYRQWRDQVVKTLVSLDRSTVVTTHFIAINVAVGAATADDRLVCFQPDHCSWTVLEVKDGRLHLLSLGRERETFVL
jgi:broad specificity phosphatase PhoE